MDGGWGGGPGQSTGFTVWTPPGHPEMKVRQAPAAARRWLREDGRALGEEAVTWPPFSGSRRLVVRFGSYALHRPPPREEGGKHQGPEARPKVKAHWGPPQRPPAAGTGSQHQQPFLRWWWAAEADSPLGHHESVSPPSPGFREARVPRVRISVSAPRLPGSSGFPLPTPGTGKAGSPVCYMVQKKSPALARVSGGGGILPPESPTSPGRV